MYNNIYNRHFRKLYNIFNHELSLIKEPRILEFGVSDQAMSTQFFLKYCELNSGKLYSIDVNNYKHKFASNNWHFFQSRDDNFDYLENQLPSSFDVIYLDTIHKSFHVEKIFYHYYTKLKVNGYFLIDDISWLPYVKKSEKDQFFMEINNEETFCKILEIFYSNRENFDLEFSFVGTGVAKIKKLNANFLEKPQNIISRKYTGLNIIRKIIRSIKS